MSKSPIEKPRGLAPVAFAAVPLLVVLDTAALAQGNPERSAYFGETHVHTSWSFDAYIFGNHITGPADAYKYAKGEPIKHPLGYDVKITTPLDWMGVTDHSEYAGVVRLSNDPSSPISKLPIAEQLKVKDAADIQRIYLWLGTSMIKAQPIEALVKPEISDTVWKANNAAADAANEPGKFTAFCSYEWTSNPDFRNMHRNIFFKDCAKVPSQPFSSLQSQAPEDLWNWMDAQRGAGNELLPVATCLLDRETRYVAANQKYAALFDMSLAELKGRRMSDFCPPELVANARRDFVALDSGELVADHEITLKGKAYLVSVNPLHRDGAASTLAISVALTDISRLKKLEAGLAKSNEHLFEAYKDIKAFSETDTLTGLFNRHGMEILLAKEVRRARRERTPIAAAMVDVDWFKAYNDGYGHVAGDAALKLVGQAIPSAIRRPGDWAARYGGEEFLVVLPDTDVEGARHIAMNILRAMNDLDLAHAGSLFGRVTVSVGVAGIDRVARDADVHRTCELLMSDADKALYKAKADGRSVVKVYSET